MVKKAEKKCKTGFTLIELLIVIAIIGLLSSVVLASLNNARKKARDAKRRMDLKQLATALEMYFDANGSYPLTAIECVASGGWCGNCSTYGGKGISGASGWVPNLAPGFIPVLPLDPNKNEPNGCYLYKSLDGMEYKILAHQTTESVCPVPSTDTMYDPVRAGQCTLQVSTPGARNSY